MVIKYMASFLDTHIIYQFYFLKSIPSSEIHCHKCCTNKAFHWCDMHAGDVNIRPPFLDTHINCQFYFLKSIPSSEIHCHKFCTNKASNWCDMHDDDLNIRPPFLDTHIHINCQFYFHSSIPSSEIYCNMHHKLHLHGLSPVWNAWWWLNECVPILGHTLIINFIFLWVFHHQKFIVT